MGRRSSILGGSTRTKRRRSRISRRRAGSAARWRTTRRRPPDEDAHRRQGGDRDDRPPREEQGPPVLHRGRASTGRTVPSSRPGSTSICILWTGFRRRAASPESGAPPAAWFTTPPHWGISEQGTAGNHQGVLRVHQLPRRERRPGPRRARSARPDGQHHRRLPQRSRLSPGRAGPVDEADVVRALRARAADRRRSGNHGEGTFDVEGRRVPGPLSNARSAGWRAARLEVCTAAR